MRAIGIGAWLVVAIACVQEPAGTKQAAAPAAQKQAELKPIRIEVWHDTVCPWCRIGLHNLEGVVDAWDGPPIEVVHHAFLLEPGLPPEGADLRERLGAKYGEARVESMFARVTQVGAQYGIHFDFGKVRRSPSTVASHALIAWSPADKRDAVVDGLHRAYFEEGRDIGDASVLAAIAQAAGLDADDARRAVTDPQRLEAMRSEAEAASRRGISGVPYFVIGGRVLEGAQSPDALRSAIRAASGG